MTIPPSSRDETGMANQQLPSDSPQAGERTASNRGSLTSELKMGSRLGKYVVMRQLGQGGMGVVYEAQDPLLERTVAIKVLRSEDFSSESLERFLHEARSIARLNHPHVVAIHEIDQFGAGYYLVMELVSGGSAGDRLASGAPVPWREATRMVIGACRGLIAAHAAGLIHRDIKPGNILLTEAGEAKLADFGLAKAVSAGQRSLTRTGSLVGTPDFMSPEQCRSEVLDDRSDFYSLGATYYALLTGRPPFHGAGEAMQIMYAHCTRSAPDPRQVQPEIPERCVQVLERMLAKQPSQRPPNAAALLAELESVLAGDASNQAVRGASPATVSRHTSVGRAGLAALVMIVLAATGWAIRSGKVHETSEPRPTELRPALNATVASGDQPLAARIPEHPLATSGTVAGIAFSQDDAQLAWVTADRNTLTNWNLKTGKRFEIPFTDRVHCVSFDTAGRVIACGDATDELRRFDAVSGQPLPVLRAAAGSIVSLAFSGDGQLLATGLHPWQEQTPALHVHSLGAVPQTLDWPAIRGNISGLAFSPDSQTLVSASSDGKIRLWNVAARRLQDEFDVAPARPVSIAFSADGRQIAAALASEPWTVWRWNLKQSSDPLRLSGPLKDIGVVAFTPDSLAVVCAGADGIWFWNAESGTVCGQPLPSPQNSMMSALAFSHDGSLLIAGTHANTLEIWHRASWPKCTSQAAPD